MLRTTSITIDQTINGKPGRDNGGVFVLSEMPAEQAADWFMRALQMMVRAGIEVPPHIFAAGPEGFAAMGIGAMLTGLSKVPFGEVRAMLDELKGQVVSYQPPGGSTPVPGWNVIRSQIVEPTTFFTIYQEVVSLSLGFSLTERLLSYRTMVATMISAFMPNTETSTGGLES